MRPSEVSRALIRIADYIDLNDRPSRSFILSRISSIITAAFDPVASKLVETFGKKLSGAGVDWSWDTESNDIKGGSSKRFSLSGKPQDFIDNKLIGGILVVGEYEQSVLKQKIDKFEAGHPVFIVDLTANYYNKHFKEPVAFDEASAVDLGEHLVDAETFEYIGRVDGHEFKETIDELNKLVNDTLVSPPSSALSQSKGAILHRQQLQNYKSMAEKARSEKQADLESFQDPDFVAGLFEKDVFGDADINKIIIKRGEIPTPEMRKLVKGQLQSRGIKYNPLQKLQISSELYDYSNS